MLSETQGQAQNDLERHALNMAVAAVNNNPHLAAASGFSWLAAVQAAAMAILTVLQELHAAGLFTPAPTPVPNPVPVPSSK